MRLFRFFLFSCIKTSVGAFSSVPFTKQPYCINLSCKVQPDRRDDFVHLIKGNQRLTLQDEPEALQYVVGQDVQDETRFYIHEQFTSEQAFFYHKTTPHNANWKAFCATNPFIDSPTVSLYHGTHAPVSVPVRDAYCVDVTLCIDERVRKEFLKVIQNNARGSNDEEELCLQYVWGEDTTIPNVFHFHEEYLGKQGFDAHATAPHFQEWETFAATDPFTKPPVVNFYKTL
jgi:quinol monooxygenase YgiN